MGLIGRNGAGKSTTLKCILNLVHPSRGNVEILGMPFSEHEKEIKQNIGYAAGGIGYYQRKRICDIVSVTRGFYSNWDNDVYLRNLKRFSLDEEKRLMDLSEGMKVKCNLTLALSHHAKLLILDEPTSGLDPVSREELLEIFLDLAAQGVSILFSTHITSDLEQCADAVTYIRNGRVTASKKTEDFIGAYRLVPASAEASAAQRQAYLGVCRARDGDTALIACEDSHLFPFAQLQIPDLQTVMVHLEKEGAQ